MGRKEKSDPIDAEVLALFGERIRPEIRPLPSEQAQRMRALVKRRRQLVEMIGAEENRLERADDSARSSIERHLDFLQEELAETEETLEETLRQSEAWKVQEQLLCSVPGLGKTTARTLLALLPELGEANREEIAKLAGVAPIVQESGRWKGERHIEGGRPAARALHGDYDGYSAQPANSTVLPAAAGPRERWEGRLDCRNAKTACDFEYDDEDRDAVAA